MKRISKLLSVFIAITVLSQVVHGTNAVTIVSAPPISYVDAGLSARINATQTVLDVKNSASSMLDFPTVTFGNYVQTAIPFIKSPIEWIILEKRGNVAVLMSKYVLDQQQFHNIETPIVWNLSYLYNWLNTTFFNTAFNDQEKLSILQNNSVAIGNVYTLNINEISYYFVDNVRRDFSATTPTQNALLKPNSNAAEKGGYWLRNENEGYALNASKVLFNGIADTVQCSAVNTFGVRPVINVVFDPSSYPVQPIAPVTPTPVPVPTPEPVVDRRACYEGRVYKNGVNKKQFTVSYYSDRVNSIDGRISIRVNLLMPRIRSDNPLKESYVNNMLALQGYSMMKGYIRDFCENKRITNQRVKVFTPYIDRDQDETVEIPFEMDCYGYIGKLIVDIPMGVVNLEEVN